MPPNSNLLALSPQTVSITGMQSTYNMKVHALEKKGGYLCPKQIDMTAVLCLDADPTPDEYCLFDSRAALPAKPTGSRKFSIFTIGCYPL